MSNVELPPLTSKLRTESWNQFWGRVVNERTEQLYKALQRIEDLEASLAKQNALEENLIAAAEKIAERIP